MSWTTFIAIVCNGCGKRYVSPRPVMAATPEGIDLVRAEAGMLGWDYCPDPDPESGMHLDLCPECCNPKDPDA